MQVHVLDTMQDLLNMDYFSEYCHVGLSLTHFSSELVNADGALVAIALLMRNWI